VNGNGGWKSHARMHGRVGRGRAAAPRMRGVWVDGPGQGLPDPAPVVPHRIIRAFPELIAD